MRLIAPGGIDAILGIAKNKLKQMRQLWIGALLFIAVGMPLTGLSGQNSPIEEVGSYVIKQSSDFMLSPDRSFGEYFVFEHNTENTTVYLSKAPKPYERSKDLSAQLTATAVDFYYLGFFKYKRKSSSYRLKFLDVPKAHFTRYAREKKIRGKERVYVFFHKKGNALYETVVFADTGKKYIPKSARSFIENVQLKPGGSDE